MGKDPAFLFYPNDYLGGTMGFTLGQHGAYLLLLICQFNQGKFSEEIALNLVGDTWNDIKNKFKIDKENTYYNQRLLDEQNKRNIFSKKQSKNAGVRWGKNDKPLSNIHLNTMPPHDFGNAKRMPSISISNSNKNILIIPTINDVKNYCLERKNNVDAERFIAHYESNGWMVGKNKMKNWQAAVRTWEKNDYQTTPTIPAKRILQ